MWSQNEKGWRNVHHQQQETRRAVNIINLALVELQRALWISRTQGKPSSGALCTSRGTAEISISVVCCTDAHAVN